MQCHIICRCTGTAVGYRARQNNSDAGRSFKLGLHLPRELVLFIVDLAKWGFTKEEAHMHREVLTKERKYYVDENNRLWERDFSFCEH